MPGILFIIVLCIGRWAVLNGLLHDFFVLRSDHGKKYDRDLLRLLMDGHILITCGLFQMVAAIGLRNGDVWAYYTAGIACISLLAYCAMIFPFLKSIATITLNLGLIVILVYGYFQ